MTPTALAPLARLPRRDAVPVAAVQGTLALDLSPAPLPELPRLHGRDGDGADVVSIDLLLRRQLQRWSRRYAQAVVEVVGGDRPATQVVRWTAPEVYLDLQRRAQVVGRVSGPLLGPVPARPPVRPVVRSAHISLVATGVAEVAVHVRYGERSRALAMRLELTRGRWLCTAIDFA